MSNNEYEQQQFWNEKPKWITWVTDSGVKFTFLNIDHDVKIGNPHPVDKDEKWSFNCTVLNFNKDDIKPINLSNGKQ